MNACLEKEFLEDKRLLCSFVSAQHTQYGVKSFLKEHSHFHALAFTQIFYISYEILILKYYSPTVADGKTFVLVFCVL